MNWLDIVILIVLLGFAFWGFKNGIVRWAFTLGGFIVGAVLAGQWHRPLAENVFSSLSPSVARIVSFIAIFIVVLVVALIAGTIIRKVMSLLFLGWLDRLGGLAAGMITGAILTALLVVLVARFFALPVDIPAGLAPKEMEGYLETWRGTARFREAAYNAVQGSAIAHFYLKSFPLLLGLLPSEFDVVRNFFK